MRLISFVLTGVLFCSCNKNKNEAGTAFSGVWVETTLRKDTLDFEADKLTDRGSAMVVFNSNTYLYRYSFESQLSHKPFHFIQLLF